MFRTPREAVTGGAVTAERLPLPSTGRPPTPPSRSQRPATYAPDMTTASPVVSSTTQFLGRSKTLPKKTPTMTGKTKGKTNGNIMTFFKKSDSKASQDFATNEEDLGLFFDGPIETPEVQGMMQTPTPPRDTSSEKSPSDTQSPLEKYNEDLYPVKRRRIALHLSKAKIERDPIPVRRGPFVDDSDDDYQESVRVTPQGSENVWKTANQDVIAPISIRDSVLQQEEGAEIQKSAQRPELEREATSLAIIDEFEDMEDFIDDESLEAGEEYLERRWMEDQDQMETEMELAEEDTNEPLDNGFDCIKESKAIAVETVLSPTCPICGGNTADMSEERVAVHVNDCLDGKAAPLPKHSPASKPIVTENSILQAKYVPGHKRFQRAAIARPGQDNPFSLIQASGTSSSAFSKLMSGHAEDNAWATAAAAEASSRGKPAYQRTCPFYKIMPGLYICVDAFRYGAVAGCNAYFLSHFHSDHYIGLTSSWCHGPIYCSHVTANLVRRQLRVDPKWIVDLEFDRKVEVPNTQGVDVTMIPANHCPGSSLFLFEKLLSKGKTPKTQRILHCGDFRACPAHVKHPQLRPDIIDQVSGKMAQQKLDVCYLDTTYLTPRYAFPNQEEVIKACADMCVSLSKDFVDDNDDWEKVKKERAGEGMVKFVRKASVKDDYVKEEVEDEIKVEEDDVTVNLEGVSHVNAEAKPTPNNKARGRLLVIVGTYSIGKERICLGVAKALSSKIYAPPNKQRIVAALEDPEFSARMTDDPLQAQVHMQMLMEIRAETLADYLTGFKPHFSRIVGFRPSGWNYRPPNSRFTESPSVQTVLHSENWKSRYSMAELVPQRGSTREANCFGVPYSEHSSFRELTMFCCALRIDKIIPTVNVGSAKSRERMKAWCEKWAMEKKKNGLYKISEAQTSW